MKKIALLLLILIIIFMPAVLAEFRVQVLEYKIVDRNKKEINEVKVTEPFTLKLKIKNIGTENIITGRLSFYCTSIDYGGDNMLCGEIGLGSMAYLGRKSIELKVGKIVTFIVKGKFHENAPPGKWIIRSNIDFTGQGTDVHVPQPVLEVKVVNPNPNWAAVKAVKAEYFPKEGKAIKDYKPTYVGEKYSIEFLIKNFNPKHSVKVEGFLNGQSGCAEANKWFDLNLDAREEKKVTFENCKVWKLGQNNTNISIRFKGLTLTAGPYWNFYIGESGWPYWGKIYLKKGPLQPNTTEAIFAKIYNFGNAPIKSGSKLVMELKELLPQEDGSLKESGKVIKAEKILKEEIHTYGKRKQEIEFDTLKKNWVLNYKVCINIKSNGKLLHNYSSNCVIYRFVPEIYAKVTGKKYDDGKVKCKLIKTVREKKYDCTVKESGMKWMKFDFSEPEFQALKTDKELKIEVVPYEMITYILDSIIIQGNPWDEATQKWRHYYFTLPNKEAAGAVSAPGINLLEGIIVLVIGVLVFAIYFRRIQ